MYGSQSVEDMMDLWEAEGKWLGGSGQEKDDPFDLFQGNMPGSSGVGGGPQRTKKQRKKKTRQKNDLGSVQERRFLR